MAYNIFIFILFYSIAVVPYIGMYNKALNLYTYPASPRRTPEFHVFQPYSGHKHSDMIVIGKHLSWLDMQIRSKHNQFIKSRCEN